MDSSIKICSINCRGLNDKFKRRDVLKYLRKKNFSIYCLQDVHWDQKWENMIRSEWGYETYIAGYTSNSRGVAVLVNNNFDFKVRNIQRDQAGNWIVLDITMLSMDITLVCLYGPNDDQPRFYDNMKTIMENVGNPYYIICGDFNLVQNQSMDTFNYVNINNPKAKEIVIKMKEDLDLCDPWRVLNPDTKRYTWRKNNPIKQARLDYFLISSELLNLIGVADIMPGYRTDHSIVTIGLNKGSNIIRGRGSWKFNNELLKEEEFLKKVTDSIAKVKKIYAASPYNRDNINDINSRDLELTIDDQLFFETLLLELRGITIAYSSKRKNDLDKREKILDNLVKDLDKLYEEAVSTNAQNVDTVKKELNDTKHQLEEIRAIKVKGSFVRTKAKWIEDGEKPSKYFLNLEKRNFVSKQIHRIVKNDDTEVTSQKDIENEIVNFYENLYKSRDEHRNLTIDDHDICISKLTQLQKGKLEGEITLSELSIALKSMANNKTPGPDGFTVEFYKTFWDEISIFLLRSLNEGFRKGSLTKEQKLGHVTLLPKGEKPRQFLKNWRPISLLNVSYKLASACISNRIKSVLPNVISEDQTGFVPNRFIGENIRLLYDILNYTENHQIPGMLLLIDFEKAFDTVSHSFILETLKAFNFGTDICRWFETLYKNASSSVIINGNISRPFQIQRSCRQGDPLAPYIFVLCAEILASMIREDTNIKGISINDMNFKITQYADDTTLILDGTEDSLKYAFETLHRFREMSGLKINIDKTVAVWIGSYKNRNTKICDNLKITWNFDGCFDFLGISFNTNLNEMVKQNYDDSFNLMKKLIAIWKKRHLTVLGRVVVVKSLVLPKLSYIAQMLPNPSKVFIKAVNEEFFRYIWNDKPDRIKRVKFIQNYESGGVKMPDVESHINALKINWIRRVAQGNKKWLTLFKLCVNMEINDVCCMGLSKFDAMKKNIKNEFWYDVLFSWSSLISIVNNDDLDFNRIAKQYLWWNDKIKVGNKSVKYANWEERGVRFVNDLLNDNGTFMSKDEFEGLYNVRTNTVQYYGIIRAIKSNFNLKDLNRVKLTSPFRPNNMDVLFKQWKGCKLFYNTFVRSKRIKQSKNIWQTEFRMDNDDWKDVCDLNFTFSTDTKYRWFQYRINQNILATNSFLKKINIRNDDLCTFCNISQETIKHLFIDCPVSKIFWNNVKSWIRTKTNVDLELISATILFGSKYDLVLTLIMVLAKYHIYRAKMLEKLPELNTLKQEIKYYYKLLKYQAVCNFEIDKLLVKWNLWQSLIA